MKIQGLAVLIGICGLLWAEDEPMKKVQVSHTERMEFPAGGLLRLKNSAGEVSVEGWDQREIEITTVKSTTSAVAVGDREKASHELDGVRISTERKGEEIVVATQFPRHYRGLLHPTDLEYRIKVPMDAKLAVEHGSGEVHVDNLTSDIHVRVRDGGVTLLLPPEGKYAIDAKSTAGEVMSDFPGRHTRKMWGLGHQVVQTTGTQKLDLRVGYGDIMILKIERQPAPIAVTQ
jgi:Putative adhesin